MRKKIYKQPLVEERKTGQLLSFSHIYNAPYWLILKEFDRTTGVLRLRNAATITEKKAARDTLHDL